MLPRPHRLKQRGHFRAVQSRGRKFVGRHVIGRGLETGALPGRFGFSVSERVGNAVVRNKVKRRMRAAVRLCLPQCEQGWDVVLIARQSSAEASYEELSRDIQQALSVLCRPGKSQAPKAPPRDDRCRPEA